MADAFTGEIRMFGFTYATEGWAFCNGQSIPIAQNQALYSVVGNIFGASTQTTFVLPNLKAMAPIGMGQVSGLTTRVIGKQYGNPQVTLLDNNTPGHNHNAVGSKENTTESNTPTNMYPAALAGSSAYKEYSTGSLDPSMIPMASQSLSYAGGGQQVLPHENRQPFTVVNFCICLNGYYPVKP